MKKAEQFTSTNSDWKRWAFVTSRVRKEFSGELKDWEINDMIEEIIKEYKKRCHYGVA